MSDEEKTYEQTKAALEDAIREHFRVMWKRDDDSPEDTVIVQWMVPIFWREFRSEAHANSHGYYVEQSDGIATHESKGLLLQAAEWLDEEELASHWPDDDEEDE